MRAAGPKTIIPFLKWAGGKRWFVEGHQHLFPHSYGTYIEPFLGGGAVFFRLQPQKAILADSNAELVEVYQAVRDNWPSLEKLLSGHQAQHSKDYYYRIRAAKMDCPVKRAAQFIYLNRTCWNGLYRVNLKGQFNVPIGTKTNVVLDTDDFESMSESLKNVEILASDFETIMDRSSQGDFIFLDPPYTVKHNHNGFIKYNESLFSWNDQIRLRDATIRAVERGAQVLLTNASHDCIRNLYQGIGQLITVTRPSVISGKKEGRGAYDEMVIKCF